MRDYTIKLLDDVEIESGLILFNSVFGINRTLEWWNRKHVYNPNGKSLFVGAFYNNELVAINGFMPFTYTYGGEEYRALESCESAVDKEHRHRGLFSTLITFMHEWAKKNNYDFLFGMPNMNSAPGFEKLGWKTVEEQVNYGKIMNINKWVHNKINSNIRPLTDLMMVINKCKDVFFWRNFCEVIEIKKENFAKYINSQNSLKLKYNQALLEWRLSEEGKIFSVNYQGESIALTIIDKGQILFLEFVSSDEYLCTIGLRSICNKVLNKQPFVSIAVEKDSRNERIAKNAAFISKREPVQTVIAFILSERAEQIDIDRNFQPIEGDCF